MWYQFRVIIRPIFCSLTKDSATRFYFLSSKSAILSFISLFSIPTLLHSVHRLRSRSSYPFLFYAPTPECVIRSFHFYVPITKSVIRPFHFLCSDYGVGHPIFLFSIFQLFHFPCSDYGVSHPTLSFSVFRPRSRSSDSLFFCASTLQVEPTIPTSFPDPDIDFTTLITII